MHVTSENFLVGVVFLVGVRRRLTKSTIPRTRYRLVVSLGLTSAAQLNGSLHLSPLLAREELTIILMSLARIESKDTSNQEIFSSSGRLPH